MPAALTPQFISLIPLVFLIDHSTFPRLLLPTDILHKTTKTNYLEIQADELQASLAKAGIDLSDADLEQFIKAMDKDGDGAIDFQEWRDFLVVSPASALFLFLICFCFLLFPISLSLAARLLQTATRFHARVDITRNKIRLEQGKNK